MPKFTQEDVGKEIVYYTRRVQLPHGGGFMAQRSFRGTIRKITLGKYVWCAFHESNVRLVREDQVELLCSPTKTSNES